MMIAATGGGCPGLDALNPVCQAGGILGGLGGSVASAGIDAVLNGVSQWVASGAQWLLGQIGQVLTSTTTVNLSAEWFSHNYGVMTGLAAVVVLPLLLVSTLQAIYRQNPGQLVRAFLVQLPLALLLGVVAIQIVILCLSATDAMCSMVAGGASSSVSTMLGSLSSGLVAAESDPSLAAFVLLLVGLLVAAGAFVLWLELLVRAAAVYVAALFLPLALVTLVWPAISHWCRRLVETLAALILSKFVIVATLSLAASAVTSGTGFSSVLAGAALLVLATFVPFAILRLIPAVEAGAVSHLEGARQRGTAAVTRIPKSAAAFALTEGMESIGAGRLLAQAGSIGTGGGGGGGGGGVRGAAGPSGGDGGSGGAGRGPSADDLLPMVNAENGGLIADGDGMAVGIPGSLEERIGSMREQRSHGKGPNPLVGFYGDDEDDEEGSGSAGASAPYPDDFHSWMGPPMKNGSRHYWGRDASGPRLGWIPANQMPRDPFPPSSQGTE